LLLLATGLTYALCCDLLQQPVSKQPGDSIPRQELETLSSAAAAAASAGRQQPLAALATSLVNGPPLGNCICIMPSLLDMLLVGLKGPEESEPPLLSSLLRKGASALQVRMHSAC
jgi:hypothetical protein